MDIKQQMQSLQEQLLYHADRYYNQDSPEITDFEYDRMMRQLEQLEQSAARVTATEAENERLRERLKQVDELLRQIDEQHRRDIRAVKEEYQEQVTFLKDELKAWRSWHQKQE